MFKRLIRGISDTLAVFTGKVDLRMNIYLCTPEEFKKFPYDKGEDEFKAMLCSLLSAYPQFVHIDFSVANDEETKNNENNESEEQK